MGRWEPGEVKEHVGPIHRVETAFEDYWCEADDLLAESARRNDLLVMGTRVWGRWLDGFWYAGTIAGVQGSLLRRVEWDDGDNMWTENRNLVVMAIQAVTVDVGKVVLAPRWDGRYESAKVESVEGHRFRVVFEDGDEAWAGEEDVRTFLPNPFVA
jgi:hypothetical protein